MVALRFKNIIIYLISAGMILSTGSIYQHMYGMDTFPILTILFMTLFIFIDIILKKKNIEISFSGLLGMLFLIIIPFLSDFINFVQSFQITFFHIVVITLSFLLGQRTREKIFNAYLNLIVILALISLGYFFLNIFFGIDSILNPIIFDHPTHPGVSWKTYPLWSTINLKLGIFIRNESIFFEPGAYVVHLIISIMLATKYKKNSHSLLLLGTLVTTFSTTAYLFIIFYLVFQLFYKQFRVIKFKYLFMFFIFLFVSLNIADRKIEGQHWSLLQHVSKTLFSKFTPNNTSYSSFKSRSMYWVDASRMFIENVFLGNGHYSTHTSKLQRVNSSSSLVGLVAEFGLFGIFCIFLYIRFNMVFKIFSVPITFIWLNGEFMAYTILLLFILGHQGDIFFRSFLTKKKFAIS